MEVDMKVQVISKEIIKPSSSTPLHPKTYKLSLLDQLAPPVYVPVILFYSSSPTTKNSSQTSDQLKKSFSETLTNFYPFAGRTKDDFCIDCNDEGAIYIEAHVAGDMSWLLQEPDIHQLQKLLPCRPYEKLPSQEMLATQVNHFDCGGLAISVCVWHAIADASALASFVQSWAAITCGNDIDEGVIFDFTSLFPPQDLSSFSLSNFVKEDAASSIVVKRFLFDASKVATLRKEIGNGPYLDHPTRFEAVSALILGAVMAVTGEENEDARINAASIAVDLRKRMIPPLPHQSIGSFCQVTIANLAEINEINTQDYNRLAGKLHESVRKMNNDYIRKLHTGGGYFSFIKNTGEELQKSPNLKVFGFSSWCKFPFYEIDFGWGKPIWLSTAFKMNKVAIFLDTRDAEGIEAWVGLSKEDMVKFEKNPGIFTYASFRPSI